MYREPHRAGTCTAWETRTERVLRSSGPRGGTSLSQAPLANRLRSAGWLARAAARAVSEVLRRWDPR